MKYLFVTADAVNNEGQQRIKERSTEKNEKIKIWLNFTPKIVPMAVVIDVTDDVRDDGSGTLSRLLTDVTNSFFKQT